MKLQFVAAIIVSLLIAVPSFAQGQGYPQGNAKTGQTIVVIELNRISPALVAEIFGDAIRGGSNVMFLPLAHVLARAVNIACFKGGALVGHFNDTKNLVPQFSVFQPTLILSVPRVFEKVYNTARQKAHDDGKGKVFDMAAETAIAWACALQSRDRPTALLLSRQNLPHQQRDEVQIQAILRTAVGLGRDHTDRLDLKITNAALAEMRAAFSPEITSPSTTATTLGIEGSSPARFSGSAGAPGACWTAAAVHVVPRSTPSELLLMGPTVREPVADVSR